jgi:hypothetical protein
MCTPSNEIDSGGGRFDPAHSPGSYSPRLVITLGTMRVGGLFARLSVTFESHNPSDRRIRSSQRTRTSSDNRKIWRNPNATTPDTTIGTNTWSANTGIKADGSAAEGGTTLDQRPILPSAP